MWFEKGLAMFGSRRVVRSARPPVVTIGLVSGAVAIAAALYPAGAAATFAAVASAVTCATTGTSACQSYTNSSSGIAVEGTSAKGTGVRASSTSNFGIKSTSSTGSAIFGQVTSSSSSGTVAGVVGTSPNGYGVYGYTTDTVGVYGVSGNGSRPLLPAGTGVVGSATNEGVGVYGSGNTGTAVQGVSASGSGGDFEGGNVGLVARGTEYPIEATGKGGASVFYVDGSGNVYYNGDLMPYAHTRSRSNISEFSPRSSAPTIEDSGTAQLVGGVATVRLDSVFAQTIETGVPYRVFLTPDGDTRGLFVASKTPRGFVVRETQGGRSTIQFDYRILATSIGDGGKRMAPAAEKFDPPVFK